MVFSNRVSYPASSKVLRLLYPSCKSSVSKSDEVRISVVSTDEDVTTSSFGLAASPEVSTDVDVAISSFDCAASAPLIQVSKDVDETTSSFRLGKSLGSSGLSHMRRCKMPIMDVVEVGSRYEALSFVTLRAGESLDTDVIVELSPGTTMKVKALGESSNRRCQVETEAGEGWISVATRIGEPLIGKMSDIDAATMGLEVGSKHEVLSLVMLRTGESLDTDVIRKLKPGTIVKINALGQISNRRCNVETESGEGWISFATRQGHALIGKMSSKGGHKAMAGIVLFGSNSSKIKLLLECARVGDIRGMKKLVECRSSVMNKLLGLPNLNCSDIWGKTALMYAAAFGKKDIVNYLLSKNGCDGVDVNCMDDMQRSALHHASVHHPALHSSDQAEIVKALIDAGALIEARDCYGYTALMFAVANDYKAVAQTLLAAGANVNAKDEEGHRALDYATKYGHDDLADLLKSHGAAHLSGCASSN